MSDATRTRRPYRPARGTRRTLAVLAEADRPLTAREIAERAGRSDRSSFTSLVATMPSLERRGVVERVGLERGVTLWGVTELGRSAIGLEPRP